MQQAQTINKNNNNAMQWKDGKVNSLAYPLHTSLHLKVFLTTVSSYAGALARALGYWPSYPILALK